MKNGTYFFQVVEPHQIKCGVWDPHTYKETGMGEPLGTYLEIKRPTRKQKGRNLHQPIEYKHIKKGQLTFDLYKESENCSLPTVGEQTLLFGTMRAYLGNVMVMPASDWLEEEGPIEFSIKSEFLQITPIDGNYYFWWAFLQSSQFLKNLPLGGGGTRPRLSADDLSAMVIDIPHETIRSEIHNKLLLLSKDAWTSHYQKAVLMKNHDLL